jgi:hypothetical protein
LNILISWIMNLLTISSLVCSVNLILMTYLNLIQELF